MMQSLLVVRSLIIIFFIALYVLIYALTTNNRNIQIDNILNQQINYLENNYKVSSDRFSVISENFYNSVLNQPEMLELFHQAVNEKDEKEKSKFREKIYEMMYPHFKHLMKSGVNIMLFSLKDNRTFLRVHKPGKFGDDLSSVRYSFTYVNSMKEPISGFEQGKISHAFRNVFPLFYQGEFLGSVDISFSSEAMQENMTKLHGVDTHFILNKSIFDVKVWKSMKQVKYIQSIEHDNFFFSVTPAQLGKVFSTEKLTINEELREEITEKIEHDDPFALYDSIHNNSYVIAFFPIKNIKDKKTVAYLVSYANTPAIQNLLQKHVLINLVSIIVLLLLGAVIYSNIKQRLSLEVTVSEEVQKNKQQLEHIFNQSRLAQMGEMISMIAHQWRQPLGSIASTIADMEMKMILQKYDLTSQEGREEFSKYYISKIHMIGDLTQNLSTTIDDFRDFYKTNKKATETTVDTSILKALNIVRTPMAIDNITIVEDYSSKTTLPLYENELMQVFLNILKNSQDNFNDKKIENPTISIKSYETTSSVVVEISDNGGGVPEEIIDKIFDPYFSTKSEKNGTGLGLYMSKTIVEEHHDGSMKVKNNKEGVSFIISFHKLYLHKRENVK